ncbi:PAS domain-containing protein [Roseospira navarrensis]|uniref:PAS domain-containing protein n=1 Tax=Roseospira navarrensis TaxID=140058 RepID=A0A7X1ZJS2_9PROT|nr:PAS domain-containing protein [Roseospira navarrensis]MQX38550.1 PAS domain-containing protein [Roseospira navarrensis]
MTRDTDTTLDSLRAVAIQGYDADRRVFYWNDASTHLYGFTAAEALGRRLEDLIIPEHIQNAVVAEIAAWLAGGPPPSGGQIALRHKSGGLVRVRSNHLSLRDDEGRARLFCVDVPLEQQVALEATLNSLWPVDGDPGATGPAREPDQTPEAGALAVRTPLTAVMDFSRRLAALQFEGVDVPCGSADLAAVGLGAGVARAVEQNMALLGAAPVSLDPHSRPVPVQDILVEVAGVLLATRPDREDLVTVGSVPPDLWVHADGFLLTHALTALARFGLHNGLGRRPVMLSAQFRHGVAETVLFLVEDAGPPVPDALRLRLVSGQPVTLHARAGSDRAGLFHLSLVQRIALATGALLAFEPTAEGTNRAVLGLPAVGGG